MDREILCVVTPDKAGKRLDAYLASEVEDLSRNYAENLIGEERVHVNDGIEAKKEIESGSTCRPLVPSMWSLRTFPWTFCTKMKMSSW